MNDEQAHVFAVKLIKAQYANKIRVNVHKQVCVADDVDISNRGLLSLSDLHWDIVEGHFNCSSNLLLDLQGCPFLIEGDFDCSNNNLISLVGGPSKVIGNYDCSGNGLRDLKGLASFVDGNFSCEHTNILNLEGLPVHLKGQVYCSMTDIDYQKEYFKALAKIGITMKGKQKQRKYRKIEI